MHPSESAKVDEARILEVFLVVAELCSDAVVVTKGDNSVNTLPSISPRFDRRDALLENFSTKELVFFMPCTRLLWRATVGWACLSLVRQEAEGSSGSGAVAGKAKEDGWLVCTVERGK